MNKFQARRFFNREDITWSEILDKFPFDDPNLQVRVEESFVHIEVSWQGELDPPPKRRKKTA